MVWKWLLLAFYLAFQKHPLGTHSKLKRSSGKNAAWKFPENELLAKVKLTGVLERFRAGVTAHPSSRTAVSMPAFILK